MGIAAGPGLQSVARSLRRRRHRVGGLRTTRFVTDFARYDPQSKKWTAMHPLPEGRCRTTPSKEARARGWNLGKEETWHKHGLCSTLKPTASGTSEQPFERRALAVAVKGERTMPRRMNSDGERRPTSTIST
jgi:hypothetical protein